MKLRLLTALGLALMAAALVLQYRPDAWGPRVTDELLHAPSSHWPRPALHDGATGHFGTVIDSDWNALSTLNENWASIPVEVRADCLKSTGDLDLTHFRHECKGWLDAARRHLGTIERAVETAEAGPPERFDPLRGEDSGHAQRLAVLGRIPALELLDREAAATDASSHDHALDACVTTLEVMRDLEWGLRATSADVDESIGTLAFYPCAHALLNASPERRAHFADQLRRIAQGRPPLAHGFELLRTTELLHFYGPTLPKRTLARADPKVTAWIARNADSINPKRLQASWDDLSSHYDALVEAAKQPFEQRLKPRASSDPLYSDDSGAFDAARSVDAVFEGLKVIAALADQTVATGRWPAPLPQGAQIKLERSHDAVTVLLDLRTHPMVLRDGSVADLPNQWTLALPQGL